MNALAEQLDMENLAELVLPELTAVLAVPEEPKRVLLVLHGAERPRASLRRARALAAQLNGQLVVLRVLPEQEEPSSLLGAISSVEVSLEQSRNLRAWCGESPRENGEARTMVRRGPLEEVACSVLQELGGVVIVISPETAGSGERAVRLSHQARVPVLVARSARSSDAIVAASNLEDRSYPVLQRAAALGERLGSPLIFVHNNTASSPRSEHRARVRLVGGPPELFRRHERLRAFARRVAPAAETVMAARKDAPEAILGVARLYDADMVVVGNHAPRGGQSVAARVIRDARRSVLVIPLPGTAEPTPTFS